MNKKFAIALVVLIVSMMVLSSCAQNRGAGYSNYGNVPPPRVSSSGGCGGGAPAQNGNDAASDVAEAFANSNL